MDNGCGRIGLFGIDTRAATEYPFTHLSTSIREMPAPEGSSAALSVVTERLQLRTIASNLSVDSVINARHQRIPVTDLHNLASAARERRADP